MQRGDASRNESEESFGLEGIECVLRHSRIDLGSSSRRQAPQDFYQDTSRISSDFLLVRRILSQWIEPAFLEEVIRIRKVSRSVRLQVDPRYFKCFQSLMIIQRQVTLVYGLAQRSLVSTLSVAEQLIYQSYMFRRVKRMLLSSFFLIMSSS